MGMRTVLIALMIEIESREIGLIKLRWNIIIMFKTELELEKPSKLGAALFHWFYIKRFFISCSDYRCHCFNMYIKITDILSNFGGSVFLYATRFHQALMHMKWSFVLAFHFKLDDFYMRYQALFVMHKLKSYLSAARSETLYIERTLYLRRASKYFRQQASRTA